MASYPNDRLRGLGRRGGETIFGDIANRSARPETKVVQAGPRRGGGRPGRHLRRHGHLDRRGSAGARAAGDHAPLDSAIAGLEQALDGLLATR